MTKTRIDVFSMMYIVLMFLAIVIVILVHVGCQDGAYIAAVSAGVLLAATFLLAMFAVWLSDAFKPRQDSVFYLIPAIVVICAILVCLPDI